MSGTYAQPSVLCGRSHTHICRFAWRSNDVIRTITTLCFALVCTLVAIRETLAQQKAPTPTLIKNATLLTVTKGTLENSDLLIENGKIAKIGKGLTAPAGARVIDATGKYVLPGIIDCHSHSMLDAINEGSLSVTSMCRIRDVLNPNDVDLYRALAGGVTTLNLLHGSANPIGGQNQVVKIKYGRPIEEFLFPDAPPGIKFALGENPKRSNFRFPGQAQRYPNSRMGVEETIRDAFVRAQDYKRQWDEYNAAKARGDKKSNKN